MIKAAVLCSALRKMDFEFVHFTPVFTCDTNSEREGIVVHYLGIALFYNFDLHFQRSAE